MQNGGKYINLCNGANIKSVTQSAGGIIGWCEGDADIYNCYNYGNIGSEPSAGWINGRAGGIVGVQGNGSTAGTINIINSCSTGVLTGDTKGGIFGFAIFGNRQLNNCYYLEGTATRALNDYWSRHIVGNSVSKENIENGTVCDYLNEYIISNINNEEVNIKEWCKWNNDDLHQLKLEFGNLWNTTLNCWDH